MFMFLLFFACSTPTPASKPNEITPEYKTTSAIPVPVEASEITPSEPIGRDVCTDLERITWKGHIWLVGGDEPTLADVIEIGDGKKVACALAWPFVHPNFAEYSFCEKRSGRGKCIAAREELETLDE